LPKIIKDFSAKKWIVERAPKVTTLTAPIIQRGPAGSVPLR
jgi:hypothetical protein